MERSYLIFFLRLNIEIILSCGNFLPKITFHFSYLSIFDLKLVFTIFLLANYNSQIYICIRKTDCCFDHYFRRSEFVLVLERSIGSAS